MFSGADDGADAEKAGGLSAGCGDGADAAFQRRDTFFQYSVGGIGYPRVNMSGSLDVENRCGVVRTLEDIGCGLINRCCPGVGGLIRMLFCMQTQGVEIECFCHIGLAR